MRFLFLIKRKNSFSGNSNKRPVKSRKKNRLYALQKTGGRHSKPFKSDQKSQGCNHFLRLRKSSGNRPFYRVPKYDYSQFVKKATYNPQKAQEYIPKYIFAEMPINTVLRQNIASFGFKKPTPIQDQTIPHILEGKDVLGIANTGTGKTGAFLIPLIHRATLNDHENTLILAPTRELALQIRKEFDKLANGLHIGVAMAIGGIRMQKQLINIRKTTQFLIGTPGRVKDLINRKKVRAERFRNIVLDEVDRMLDMGFIADIKHILKGLPAERQFLFFSATMEGKTERVCEEFLRDPVRVIIPSCQTSENVHQDIVLVRSIGEKEDKLFEIVSAKDVCKKVLVFTRTKRSAQHLMHNLVKRGIIADAIHSNLSQNARQRAIRKFRENRTHVLVATDVAARGLDVNNITHVINYDLPMSYEDYIHRIGRTGRADKIGTALTFVVKGR